MDGEDKKAAIAIGSALALSALIRRGVTNPDGANALPSPEWAANMAVGYASALAKRLEAEWPSVS